MAQWISRSKDVLLQYSGSRNRCSIDMKEDANTDKPFLSCSSPPSRSSSLFHSGNSPRLLHGHSFTGRLSTRPMTTEIDTTSTSPWSPPIAATTTATTPTTITVPCSDLHTSKSRSTLKSAHTLPIRLSKPPIPLCRSATPRTAKRIWKRFCKTELAGMMGVANSGPHQHPSSKTLRGGRSSQSDSAGDDPLDVAARQKPREPSREQSTYPAGMVGSTSSAHLGTATGNEDASSSQSSRNVLYPIVKIRPEYNTVYRKDRTGEQGKQNVVCVISLEVPSRRPVSSADEDEQLWLERINYRSREKEGKGSVDDNLSDLEDETEQHKHKVDMVQGDEEEEEHDVKSNSSDGEEGFSFSATPSAIQADKLDPFANVVEDLRKRISDWKGHTVDRFGPLVLYDFLGVRQESVVREFYVYLFKEALLCVIEEKKREKGLARLMGSDKNGANGTNHFEDLNGSSLVRTNKPALKLKGRIWLRHIQQCQLLDTETSTHCLSIKLDDESLDHFVLCFKEKGHREMWKNKINELLEQQSKAASTVKFSSKQARMQQELPAPPIDVVDETKALKVNRRYTAASTSGHSVQSGKSGSTNLTTSPPTSFASPKTGGVAVASGGVPASTYTTPPRAGSTRNNQGKALPFNSRTNRHLSIPGVPTHQQWSSSGGLDPNLPPPDLLPHTPIDLVIMVSIPSVTAQTGVSSSTLSSSAALKVRLIRSTLDFIVSHLGPNDRIALVAYHVGIDGLVRRTSLLNTFKQSSKEKLEQFIETIGKPWEGTMPDPFVEDVDRLGGSSDRTDTVTAVNVGFDIVLQRKSKNPITGMILINDTADAPKRGQMDLVMARAEAARVPVHCFGFGKSHDPSSLWLISNHTRGSYTFVKEWYQLRECVSGCVGSLMSIALNDVKLHITVPSDNHFKVRKVSGPSGAIVSSTGKDVDVELGELRFGDCKELFVELELDFDGFLTSMQHHSIRGNTTKKTIVDHYEKGSATDDFMQRLGLQGLSLSNAAEQSTSYDQSSWESNYLEEVAVLEVDVGCKDPSIHYTTTRLPTPAVLTLEINGSSPDPISGVGATMANLATALADPVVTRRRLEILVSDMITRCLLLVSRRNQSQALTILLETRRIVDTVLQAIPIDQHQNDMYTSTPNQANRISLAKKQKELLHRKTAISLLAILEDLDVLIEGLETNQNVSFERTERNFGAQQAMILRDQKAWTSRTDTEWQFHRNIDNAAAYAAQAAVFALVGRSC